MSETVIARYFDPKLGRFLSQDSFLGQIESPPSLHRYFYGYANPVRYIDLTGHAGSDAQARHFGRAADERVKLTVPEQVVAQGVESLASLAWDKVRSVHEFGVNTFGSLMFTYAGAESFRSQHEALADVVVPARESAYQTFKTPQHFVTAVVDSNIEMKQRYDAAFERGDLKAAQAEAIGFLSQIPAARMAVSPLTAPPGALVATPEGATMMVGTGVAANPAGPGVGILVMADTNGRKEVGGTQGEQGNFGPGGSARDPLPADKAPSQKPGSRPGRRGNPDHVADVARNNEPNNMAPGPVGNRVPDGIAEPGQVVTIRGQSIDPGPDARVIVESERFRQNGQMVGEGREQIRDIRAAEPESTIVCTDCARPEAQPVVFPPGTQPPPKGRLPKGTPKIVPYP